MKQKNKQEIEQTGGWERLRGVGPLGMIGHPRMHRGCLIERHLKTKGL